MNRTILKLFTQACYHGDYEPENVPKAVVEKFAELVVKECCQFENSYSGDAGLVARSFGRKIKEHFGVEE